MAEAEEQRQIVIAALLQLYNRVLGETTAKLYENFYKDKDLDTIMMSAQELLEEFMGKTKAVEELNNMYKQINIKSDNENE